MAFLSMGLGFKLAIKRKPEVSTFHSRSCCGNFNKTQCNIVMGNDSQHLKSPKKREATFKDFKPQQCRTTSDMAFGSDSFIPCVVLMKKQNTRSYNQNFNIGMMAKPPRTRRRASLDVIKEHNHLKEATKWSEIMHRRRTSLPAVLTSSKGKAMMSSVLVDTATLVEVQSTLDELANKKPSNINDFVKKLQNLLQPYKTDHVKPRQVVWLHDSGAEGSDEEIVCLSPRHVSNKRPFTRRPDWQTGQRNLFSTTTTATGLPKEVPGPVKPKRLPKIAKDKTPAGTPLDSRCGSPVSDGPVPSNIGRRRTFPNLPVILSAISSDYESCDNEESIPPITVRSKSATESSDPLLISESADTQDEHFTMQNTVATPSINDEVILEEDENHHGSEWKISELEDGHAFFNNYQEELLETVYNWNFRIFDLAQKTDCVLSQMSYKLFHDTGLFETCKIPKREFVCYMKVLENGYREIPYHNRIHAADVLHGCWFLSTQEIPGFRDHCPRFSSDSSDSDSGTGIAHTRQVNNIGHGSLAQAIPALELMALYLAAAMHDYDHPGRTNAFLVETRHPLAILYNDRSVLENHHASASWKLLYSDKNFDFLQNLDTAEWKRLRFLIVEAILATDLKKHFEILSQFNSKSQQCLRDIEGDDSDIPTRTGINWSADKDRLLVCQMVIKLADIGGPAKIKPLHITWTKAICEEFFIQGDEERKLNVPVSPFMDRERPQVAELQRTFIDNLIKPIVLSMHKTGVLAGKMPADAAIEHGGMAARTNLLLEQLKDNLSFWKVQTSADGHEEMKEAFKYALTTHSSLTRSSKRDCRRASSSLFAKLPQKVKDYCPNDDDQVTGSDDDVFDDATSEVVLNQLIPSDRDVIEVSSTEREQSPLVSSHVKSNNEKNLFRVSARDHRTQTTLSSCQSDGYKNKSDSTTLQ